MLKSPGTSMHRTLFVVMSGLASRGLKLRHYVHLRTFLEFRYLLSSEILYSCALNLSGPGDGLPHEARVK